MLLEAARAVLFWEGLWPRLWPAAGVAGLFVAVALLDILPLLPTWLHGLLLLAFAAGFAWALRRATTGVSAVGRAPARHRLERDSGLDHRPLTALGDHLAAGRDDRAAEVLWQAHLRRMAAAADTLRLAPPAPGLARHDPWGLRAVVVLLLVVGLAAAWGEPLPRLARALFPGAMAAAEPATVELWITPPAYTGQAPLFVDGPTERALGMPAGSALLVRLAGTWDEPGLTLGDRAVAFTGVAEAGYRAEAVIEDETRLAVTADGREVAAWTLTPVADSPPEVTFAAPPQPTAGARLRVPYKAADDYGLTAVEAVILSADGRALAGGEAELRLTLPLPRAGAKTARGSGIHDLTAHPWAGLPVIVRLEATDARGQVGESPPTAMVLPERTFNHPVARAIIEQRRKLAAPSQAMRDEVIDGLGAIAETPERFDDDTVVALALAFARARLGHDRREAAVAAVRALLWDTALRLEDGGLFLAARDLRRAREEMVRALREGAGKAELERLMDALQQALDRYLTALSTFAQQNADTDIPISPDAEFLTSDDLQRLLDEARELMRSGAADAARRLLAELQRRLDDIQIGLRFSVPPETVTQARELMEALRDLAQRQQQLLDDTFDRLRTRERGTESTPEERRREAERQESVRGDLGRLMLDSDTLLGAIPDALGEAERAMRGAADALAAGQDRLAVEGQGQALQHLREAAQGITAEIARQMGGGVAAGTRALWPGRNRDPFGRTPYPGMGGVTDDSSVRVPTKMERLRSHEILRELRRRAGERHRPRPELDYIDRLLRLF